MTFDREHPLLVAIDQNMAAYGLTARMLLLESGISVERLHETLRGDHPELVKRLMAVYAEFAGASAAAPRTLAEAIALGMYDWVHPDITEERFPFDPALFTVEGVWEEQLPHAMNLDGAGEYFDGKGLKMGGSEAATAWGKEHPGNQRQYPIVAGAASWVRPDDNRYVLSLGKYDGRRLDLRWADSEYHFEKGYRFLVSRK